MKNKKPFDLKRPLIFWNLFLSLFSFMGMFRIVPHLFLRLSTESFKSTVCSPLDLKFGSGAAGLWSLLFVFSKFPELFDTVFLVLRKKKVEFLHWYHHITVLLFCWFALINEGSNGLYFIAMNYSVHAIMYGYFGLMAANLKSPIPSYFITIAQISQMFIGTFICIMSLYYYEYDNGNCSVTKEIILSGVVMYGSYLLLFVDFAVRKYIFGVDKYTKKIKPEKKD